MLSTSSHEKSGHILTQKNGIHLFVFAVLIILYFFFMDFSSSLEQVEVFYSYLVDVSFMIFIGFGFLMTFLRRYGLGAVGFTYFISAFTVLWCCLVFGFMETLDHGVPHEKIKLNIEILINAEFCAGAVMITFGGLIGKVSSTAMIVIAFFETIFYVINFWIVCVRLKALDVGGTLTIHVFGAYFGLTCAKVLTPAKGKDHPDNASRYNSDLFSLIGTVFLYLYWPSFNAATASVDLRHRAIMNTFISITASTVSTFFVSPLFHKGKFSIIDIQNATLAGGVAIGSCAHAVVSPGATILIGSAAGAISTIGFNKVQPYLLKKINLHDTCGINNLHGMPGVYGGIIASIIAACSKEEDFRTTWETMFPDGAASQGATNILCLLISLAMAISSGFLTSVFVLRFVKSPPELFTDVAEFEVHSFEYEEDTHHFAVSPSAEFSVVIPQLEGEKTKEEAREMAPMSQGEQNQEVPQTV